MKKNLVIFILSVLAVILCFLKGGDCCSEGGNVVKTDTIYIEKKIIDTIFQQTEAYMQKGTYTCNVPYKCISILPEKEGKALLFLWLHGGVSYPNEFYFDALGSTMNNAYADDSIVSYLEQLNEKAIVIKPLCYKANIGHAIYWRDCAADVVALINDFIRNGVVDSNRVYVAGISDGGTGTWDFVHTYQDLFACGIAMSSGYSQKTTVPIYWSTTKREGNHNLDAQKYQNLGYSVYYEHYPNETHGGDQKRVSKEFLQKILTYSK